MSQEQKRDPVFQVENRYQAAKSLECLQSKECGSIMVDGERKNEVREAGRVLESRGHCKEC